MYKCFALILLLVIPSFGQLHRGVAGVLYSGLHNHFAIPIDGGKVYSYAMYHPSTTDCITSTIPNDASFTGSSTFTMSCGGSPAPTIQPTGMTISNGGFGPLSGTPDFSGGWTLTSTFNPTSVTGQRFCGIENFNYNTGNFYQYGIWVTNSSTGDFAAVYYTSATVGSGIITAGSTVPINTWSTITGRLKGSTANGAGTWFNGKTIAFTTAGDLTRAIGAVQNETDIGGNHISGATSCAGVVGFVVAHDHSINDGSLGFIYRALYHTMQFRGVAIP